MKLPCIKKQDKIIYQVIQNELKRQQEGLELIASENYTSSAVMEAQGSVLTNKYAEGLPAKRYYGGCQFVDIAEREAIDRAKKLFRTEHVNVQPHSGAQANMAVYLSVMQPGDVLMGLELAHGGHLTHGHPMNFSGKFFKVVGFSVRPDTERIDENQAEELAIKHKPKLICVGASAYSRIFNWKRFRDIADRTGAYLMADIAHYAGLVATGLYPSPVPYCDFVTTTTHKTLRGPRGGMILCREKYAKEINKTVFPGIQGGPLMHVIAAKAVALGEALKPSFKKYQTQVIRNAQTFANELTRLGFRIVSGGTDCHMFLVDLRPKNITGKEAEEILEKAGITVNKNAIPFDPQKPFIASGIRIGTPAVTTRGMKEREMKKIAKWITETIDQKSNLRVFPRIRREIAAFCKKYPIYRS